MVHLHRSLLQVLGIVFAAGQQGSFDYGQCNVSVMKADLPCRFPRCRFAGSGKNNVTQRGLAYSTALANKFYDEWGDYQGFLGLETAFFVNLVSMIQSDLGVFGAIGEIGVAAGKSFVTLAFTRRSREPLFVCDIFAGLGHPNAEKEGVEVEQDNAAMANLPMFLDTLAFAGIDDRDVAVHSGASFELTDMELHRRAGPFRLLHIDGGHYFEATLHDLRIAACSMVPGGIIMLDDLNSGIFPGVQQAFHHFMLVDRPRLRPTLVPFMLIGRLYITDRQFVEKYQKAIRQNLPEKAFWKEAKYLYGQELLLPAGLSNADPGIRNILKAEDEYFPWPQGRR
eukprot:TRINITY_DN62384_c0_g1_i1.p1 TRINITY_DN62384_c0_g1~~TRINITY_DN62384_c0_g1_i1.p1  ORF type:complete len:369 (+),score=41.65 TRINITY_DN62384_c0_g1_i1:91-1107(+)